MLRILRTVSERTFLGRNELGPTIEEFASAHQLPLRWVELRKACDRLAARPGFWYRKDLQNEARLLAVEASDIFRFSRKRSGRSTPGETSQACPQDVNETIGSDYESAHCQQAGRRKSDGVSFGATDKANLGRAVAIAKTALAYGETPVGSPAVHKRRIIAEGIESVKKHLDVSGHAELIAIRNARSTLQTFDLSGCTLCTTAEPCFMCSYAVRHTHIPRVIIGRPVGGISLHHPILT